MIEPSDYVLVGLLVGVTAIVVSLLWIIYHAQLVWDLKVQHQRELEMRNKEIIEVRGTLASREFRDRILGSTPVGRLLDD